MNKTECINIFNNLGNSLESYINLISEYLIEIKCDKNKELISLVISHPQLIQEAIPKIIEYYCRKFYIFSLTFNNKIILYYE